MKRVLTLVLVWVGVLGGAVAAQDGPANATCPVKSGTPVDPAVWVERGGEKIGFCCTGCRDRFVADPAAFQVNLPAREGAGDRSAAGAAPAEAGREGAAGAKVEGVRPLPERVWRFVGKFHPLVVHFPIALLVVACVAEFLRLRRGERRPGATAFACVMLGAASAVVAAVMGWSGAETAGHGSSAVLWWHRWLGVGSAGLAVLAAVVALASRVRGTGRVFAVYRLGVVASAGLVGVAAHFGAGLIYGEGYIGEAFAELRGTEEVRTAGAGGTRGLDLATRLASVDFVRDIEPIFAKRCYSCHTGDEVEGEFRLDVREDALAGGESGEPGIVPGRSAESRLMRLVTSGDSRERMPPRGGPLTDEQVKLIAAWIDAGAKWPSAEGAARQHWHWAYRAVSRPAAPAAGDGWARNQIDRFVLERLKREGLGPSPEASRETLIRRVSLDLTGLPPRVAEIDAFLADERPGAYERVVDRLLASPRYGERWARLWLDLARYADTHGYEKDDRRVMWPYRDWVIEAFNKDVPFDRFTIEQLAGDMLPGATTEQLIATGFHRNTMTNEEGGVDPEEFRVDAVVDRTNTTASVWLGTTLACAQCHEHKNDPFTQKDYFSFYAIFNNAEADTRIHATGATAAGAMVPVPTKGREEEFRRVRAEIAELEKTLTMQTPELDAAQAVWEAQAREEQKRWTVLTPAEMAAASGATFRVMEDGSLLVGGANDERDTYTIAADVEAGTTAIRLEVMPDESQPGKGVGRSVHSNIVLNKFAAAASGEPLVLDAAVADHEQGNEFGAGGFWPIAAAIGAAEGDAKGWAIGPKTKEPHTAAFRLASPLAAAGRVTFTLVQDYGGRHTIGRLRLSSSKGPWPPAGAVPADLMGLIAAGGGGSGGAQGRTAEQAGKLAAFYRSVAPSLAPVRARLRELKKVRSEIVVASALVMRELPRPRETFVQIRGNFLNPGERVEPGVPEVLPPLPEGEAANRLTLAKWLVDPGNPLTARVTVNRFWEQYFGQGLVGTSDDFGTQGDEPTHPELLDFLAIEFVRGGWSVKALHRLIVTSATYRQASRVTPELLEKDPENKLLARGPRFRVEAEMVRDVALAAGGLLSPKIGGPSVFPPQPDGVWTMIYSSDAWKESTGEDRYRRGLYTFWRRTAPYPTFAAFDAPSREIACTRRPRTNTPLQALTTLNDPAFVEAAAGLARRVMAEPGDAAARVVWGFRVCAARRPAEAEVSRLVRLYEEQLAHYRAAPEEARALVAGMPPPPPHAGLVTDVDAAELAAWTAVANVLLNLDEVLTKG